MLSSVKSRSALKLSANMSGSLWVLMILISAVTATLFFRCFEVPVTRLQRAQLVYFKISWSFEDKILVTRGSSTLYLRRVSLKEPSSAEILPTAQAPCSKIFSYLLLRILGRISKSPLLTRLSMWLLEPAQMLVMHQVASSWLKEPYIQVRIVWVWHMVQKVRQNVEVYNVLDVHLFLSQLLSKEDQGLMIFIALLMVITSG